MKKILYLAIMAPVFLAGCSPVIYTNSTPQPVYNDQQQAANDQPQISQEFYDQLSPYGNWIDYPDYGYVWQPNVDTNFRPYVTDGNWVYTDYGWTWASDFSWGWAPFHYGNWFYDDNYGWLWEPGQQWAPAWVTWGQSGDYYGWAPVPPRGYRGYQGGNWRPRDQDWNYVPARNIGQSNVNNYVVRNNTIVINNTTIINNVNTNSITVNRHTTTPVYNRGPQVNDVENMTHTKFQHLTIHVNNRPGQTTVNNNQLNIYQPVAKPNAATGNIKPAPQKVITYTKGGNANPNGSQNQQTPAQGKNPGMGRGQNTPPANKPETVLPAPKPGSGQATTTPAQPVVKPAQPVVKPIPPVVKPVQPVVKPAQPVVKPAQPVVKPAPPVVKPGQPVVKPTQPVVKPVQPVAKPAPPVVKPTQPVVNPAQQQGKMPHGTSDTSKKPQHKRQPGQPMKKDTVKQQH